MLIYVVLGAFVLAADRVGRWAWRRRRYENARRTAAYPLTDSTNWRQPSN
jgi:hypothetical protein